MPKLLVRKNVFANGWRELLEWIANTDGNGGFINEVFAQ